MGPLAHLRRRTRKQTFPMGGWVLPHHAHWMQRVDQGQDFEVARGAHVHAPGPGVVVRHLNDGPFPSGFGSPYAVVRIEHGAFAVGDGEWYIGHANKDVLPVGRRFEFGDPLAMADNGFRPDRGWVEIGKCLNGGPAPLSLGFGAKYHHLFVPVKRRWPR